MLPLNRAPSAPFVPPPIPELEMPGAEALLRQQAFREQFNQPRPRNWRHLPHDPSVAGDPTFMPLPHGAGPGAGPGFELLGNPAGGGLAEMPLPGMGSDMGGLTRRAGTAYMPGSAAPPMGTGGPERSPAEVEAIVAQLQAEAEAQFDRENPGLRAYNAARQANPEGRPFYNSELGQLPSEQAQHAQVTLGGNWGNAFGELDSDPTLRILRGEDGHRPVQVMAEGGGTRTIYRKPSEQRVFGGDTTVRNVGGRNMFVDRLRAESSGEVGGGGFPVPEGGYGPSEEFRQKVAETGRSSTVMPKEGDPQKRAEYLAEQERRRREGLDVTRRNYQLKQAGMRAVPVPEWMAQPGADGMSPMMWMADPKSAAAMAAIQAENARAAGQMGLGYAQMDQQARLAADERASREGLAREGNATTLEQERIRAGAREQGDNVQRWYALIKSQQPDMPDREAYEQATRRAAQEGAAAGGGGAGGMPLEGAAPEDFSLEDRTALESMSGYSNRIIDYGRARGWTPVQIDKALRAYGGDQDRTWSGFWADWLPGGADSRMYSKPWWGGLREE